MAIFKGKIRQRNSGGTYDYLLPETTIDMVNGLQDELDGKVSESELRAIKNEISILDFGADPTGVNDSTQAIQQALDYARTKIIDSQFKEVLVVVFNGGMYKVSSTLTNSPFVKIVCKGIVTINSQLTSGTIFRITPRTGDPDFISIFPKQQYNGGLYIDGGYGGLYFKGLDSTLPVIGLEIGAWDNSFGENKPTSRYGLRNISISGVRIGLQLNAYHNYIGRFERLHIEGVNTCVRHGTNTIGSVVNSGENFNFYSCLFAGSDKGIDWYLDGMDCNFYSCSFDFLNTVFKLRRGWKNVNIFGGHIEAIRDYVVDYSPEVQNESSPSVNFDGVVKYINNTNTCYSGSFTCTMKSCRMERTVRQTNNYLFSNETRLTLLGTQHPQGLITTLSPYTNLLSNGKFKTVTTFPASLPIPEFTISNSNGLTASVKQESGEKYIHIESTDNQGSGYLVLKTDTFVVDQGKLYYSFVDVYQNSNVKNINMSCTFLDKFDNILSTTNAFSNNQSSNANSRVSVKGVNGIFAPLGASKMYMEITFGGQLPTEDVKVYEIFLGRG